MNGHPDPLQVGAFSTSSLIGVADAQGFFAAEGLRVAFEEVPSSAAQMEGLRTGRYHVVHTSPDNVMAERLAGDDPVLFLVLDAGLAQHLVVRGGTAWEDIAGGVVGVDAARSGYAFVLYDLLRQHELQQDDDYEVAAIGASRTRLDALLEGTIDACLLNTAMLARGEEHGLVALVDVTAALPWYPGTACAATTDFARSHPEALHAYARALTAAARWTTAPGNSDAFRDAVAGHLDVTADEAARIIEGEEGARTSLLLSADEARENLDRVARLREAATGVRPRDYFDPTWMEALDASA